MTGHLSNKLAAADTALTRSLLWSEDNVMNLNVCRICFCSLANAACKQQWRWKYMNTALQLSQGAFVIIQHILMVVKLWCYHIIWDFHFIFRAWLSRPGPNNYHWLINGWNNEKNIINDYFTCSGPPAADIRKCGSPVLQTVLIYAWYSADKTRLQDQSGSNVNNCCVFFNTLYTVQVYTLKLFEAKQPINPELH